MANKIKDSMLKVHFSVFRKSKLTTLEERKHTYREIGVLLGRDERNIWTVYNRSLKKCKK